MMPEPHKLEDLGRQVQLLGEQLEGIRQHLHILEILLVLVFVIAVGAFLCRAVKSYQALKGTAFMRALVSPSPEDRR
jgi:hypothetical protein